MSDTTCTFNYLYFQGGPGHVRRPRPNPPTFGLVPIPGNNLGGPRPETTGAPISADQLAPKTPLHVGADIVQYIFCSISGAQTGNQTWIAPENYAALDPTQVGALMGNVIPGAGPMTVNFVYGPPAGSGPPTPPTDSGASIDCYFEGTSTLVDNNFVSVSPDNGATNTANNDGWVDTWTTPETITADKWISPDGTDPNEVSAVFDKWIDMVNPLQPTAFKGAVFTAAEKTSYYALALYKIDPCQAIRTELANFNIGDFPNPAAGEKALIALRQALLECERLNGELPIAAAE
jgi:hypothetical protein